jgi:hypothetical protein
LGTTEPLLLVDYTAQHIEQGLQSALYSESFQQFALRLQADFFCTNGGGSGRWTVDGAF